MTRCVSMRAASRSGPVRVAARALAGMLGDPLAGQLRLAAPFGDAVRVQTRCLTEGVSSSGIYRSRMGGVRISIKAAASVLTIATAATAARKAR